ncbi:MAG: D-2-hydroxyacid dehydrogenase [Saprospiraceae bacterium]
MSKRILANDGIESDGKLALEAAGFTVDTNKVDQSQLTEALQNYEVLIVRSATKVRKDLIDACPHLKIIARGGVGMDNIDVDYAREKGITVINTPNASSRAVAELAMAHMYSLSRMLNQSNAQMPKEGADFNALKKKYSAGTQLYGKTLGIVGFGRIGQELAKIAMGTGMNIIAVDPMISSVKLKLHLGGHDIALEIATSSMEDLLKNSDYISLHVPSSEKPVLGVDEMQMMKKGACIINTARGGVIDESALLGALNSGHLGGAGLDAFLNEPTPDPSILNNSKVSVSPHIGGSTIESQAAIGLELAEKIKAAYK